MVGVWEGVRCGLWSVLFLRERETLVVLYFGAAGAGDGRMGDTSRDGRGEADRFRLVEMTGVVAERVKRGEVDRDGVRREVDAMSLWAGILDDPPTPLEV